ncbi:hypothetical protein OSB04_017478 [Centaurea solstitialis]|uniref:Uncharacterized protein n=1 Tax=Centaurea solstitialis TaxID=347529 RepID=A0AA38TMY7_9ASTR|nr:hypothetical protein OSB04_017478 [Centaurea solstitialis]
MYGEVLEDLKQKVGGTDLTFLSAKDKADAFCDCYGIEQPEDVDIFAPIGIRNKGCGKGKRLKGTMEKATNKCSSSKRLCRSCGEHANHDSCNCP